MINDVLEAGFKPKIMGCYMFFKSKRRLLLLGIDFSIMLAVYGLSLLVSVFASETNQLALETTGYVFNFLIFSLLIFSLRFATHCYSNVWRYANSLVFIKVVAADAAGGILALIITKFIESVDIGLWMSCSFVTMCNIVTLSSRFVYQFYYRSRN